MLLFIILLLFVVLAVQWWEAHKLMEADERLHRIIRLLVMVNQKENRQMGFNQELLDAMAALDSSVDSVILWIQSQDFLDQATKDKMIAALTTDKAKLDAVIPPPPVA